MIKRINEDQKVAILEEILKVKDILFNETISDDSKNAEWKRIADFAHKKLKINGRDYKFFKRSFWYNCKSSLGRKKMDKKKLPLTRAHMLTMEILGMNSAKALRKNNKINKEDTSSSSSDDEDIEMNSSDFVPSTPSKKKETEDKENQSPRAKKVSEREEEIKEMRAMKKRKLQLEIDHAEILLKKEKANDSKQEEVVECST